jgi:predicted metalloprotease with PDZ domain
MCIRDSLALFCGLAWAGDRLPAQSADAAPAAPDLRYLLAYDGGGTLHVTLSYAPLRRDVTTFTYGEPRFGGQADIFDSLANIQASPPARLSVDAATRTITVEHPGDGPVTIEYDVRESHMAEQGMKGELFRPMIRADYFYCHGINLFLRMDLRPQGRIIRQSVAWAKRPRFPLYYPFDPENRGERPALWDDDAALLSPLTGSDDLSVDRIAVGRSPAYLVLRINRRNDFNRKLILDYFARYYAALRRFWRDDGDRPFSLMLQPFLEARHDIGGMAFGSGFLSKYAPVSDTILTPDRVFNLSHEIGHYWLGSGGLHMGMDHQWFSEGFNDFVTYAVLLAARFSLPRSFVHALDVVFGKLYASPVRNTPNADVFRNYWTMGDYNKLPYWRGCLFAFYLDNRIGLATDGAKGLRDLLLELRARRKGAPGDEGMTVPEFVEAASVFLPRDEVQSALDAYIIAGQPIPFSRDMLLPMYRIDGKDGIPTLSVADEKALFARFGID